MDGGPYRRHSHADGEDLKVLKDRIDQTLGSNRLSVGLATLLGYPKEMFAREADLRSRIGRLAAVQREIDQDYLEWVFNRSNELASKICDTGEVLFGVAPFARQIPMAYLGLIAKECATAAISGSVMAKIVANITKEPIFDDDKHLMAHVRNQLLESGLRYLAGDFCELVGEPDLVLLKREIIAQIMHGLNGREDIEHVLDNGIRILQPKLNAAAAEMRGKFKHKTTIVLTGTREWMMISL